MCKGRCVRVDDPDSDDSDSYFEEGPPDDGPVTGGFFIFTLAFQGATRYVGVGALILLGLDIIWCISWCFGCTCKAGHAELSLQEEEEAGQEV
jgi:hypothetical protein